VRQRGRETLRLPFGIRCFPRIGARQRRLKCSEKEAARKALAAAMLASFIALLFGGAAAFLGGWWSKEIRTELGA